MLDLDFTLGIGSIPSTPAWKEVQADIDVAA